jgi:hypothetical protein
VTFSATMVARCDAPPLPSPRFPLPSRRCFPLLRLRTRGRRDGALSAELAYAGGRRARAEGTVVLPDAVHAVRRSMRRAVGSRPGTSAAEAVVDADADADAKANAAARAGHGVQLTAALGSVEGTRDGVAASLSLSAATALGVATGHAAVGGPVGLVVEAPLRSGFVSLDFLATPGAQVPAVRLCAGFYN